MIGFEDLIEKVRRSNPEADLDLLRRAYLFSAFEHQGQVRRSGEPYLVHPLEVADILADMRLDVVAIAAGLLHDIVEDTPNTIEKVRELFGEQVAHVVEGVTKLSSLQFASSEERQAESFRKMLMAMVDDIRVILVKLADRLHNMRTLQHLPEERRARIAQETRDIYAPLANRLGMSKIKNELEELAFKYLEPAAYQALHEDVERKRQATEGLIDALIRQLDARLKEAQLPVVRIDGRIKRLWSIHQKLQRQRISLDQVYDFIALRVITTSVKDCYGVLGIIHQMWSPVPGRFKDFIAMPRPNGYQSLHTSVVGDGGVPFEVQIRTEDMHRIAEEGIAAHWKYKEGRVGAERDEQYFAWLRRLLELQQEVRDPQEFMQNLRIELYPEEVYIFTPKGEVKSLPRGATPVDFAYLVHTDIGHQCVGARINGRMVPLRTRLNNGDIVEILTQPGHAPSRDWLNFVATSRARNKIRHFIQSEEKARSVELGRRLFDKDVRRFAVDRALLTDEALSKVAGDFGSTKVDDLYAAIGYGKVTVRAVLTRLVGQEQLKEREPETSLPSTTKRPAGAGADEHKIKVRGIDDIMVFRARCCNPIRGEQIVGYITRGKGVSVHAATCPNVLNLLFDPERRIAVEWDSGTDVLPYTVRLKISVEDRRGILADVTSCIASINTNIKDVEATVGEDHRGSIRMTVEISDVRHLDRVMKSIRSVDGVLAVERATR
ncbi:MAG TPA: bifunctional (p)ppGpp synthetase/guanosine-3',5'-bis(diphosphate) 3'-pyrophosphohydrolase [Vicinamibacterales bacterium]|jgi:GTP pyrophosphokinase|nr:bifunctional (p)ppGpp synthetase/guanosine-3',5'-bis(diphosphate) 3'-pyrophosphohydrolase [Vicinamibacterales bacterium]